MCKIYHILQCLLSILTTLLLWLRFRGAQFEKAPS